VIGILGDQPPGRRSPSVGMPPSIRRLGAGACTTPSSQARQALFGSPDHQNPELGGDDVEPLGAILADDVQQTTAAGAVLILNVDHHLDARQVAWQRATVRAALRCLRLLLSRSSLAAVCSTSSRPNQQLILGKRFGPAAETDKRCISLMICSSRSARVRSASSIAFNVLGSLGSESVGDAMARLDHASHHLASIRAALIHSAAIIPAASAPASLAFA